jgi:hypothetical protein
MHLSVEHSGYTFQADVKTAVKMLALHSGGSVSEALQMSWRTDPTQFSPILQINEQS